MPTAAPQRFTGFPSTTLTLLRELTEHNEKTWFDAHRADYERDYLQPALAFIAAMDGPLRELHPDVHAEPRVNGSLFRVDRDVRFSTDKRPYKDHLDLFFWVGEGRSRERPGFFRRLRADRLLLGAGMHAFDPGALEAYRSAVLADAKASALESAIVAARSGGAAVEGSPARKVPAGVDPGHPRSELLRYTALHASSEEPVPASLTTPAFVDHCVGRFRPLAPLLAWIADL
jgi:uncharacterized protein (TIGR02453 family)